jgi:hypothetical protein
MILGFALKVYVVGTLFWLSLWLYMWHEGRTYMRTTASEQRQRALRVALFPLWPAWMISFLWRVVRRLCIDLFPSTVREPGREKSEMITYIVVMRNPQTLKILALSDDDGVLCEFQDEQGAIEAAQESEACRAWGFEVVPVTGKGD